MPRQISRLQRFKNAMVEEIKANTNAIEVGGTYFLSNFHDKSGCNVKVLSKSTKINAAGWPSSVQVRVVVTIGMDSAWDLKYYAIDSIHNANASNLYTDRSLAAHGK